MGRQIYDRQAHLLEDALRRVRELFSEAETGKLNGHVTVAIHFKQGVPQSVNDERKRFGDKQAD